MTVIRAEELLTRKVGRFLTHFADGWSSNPSLKHVLGEVRGSHWKTKIEEIRQIEAKINSDISETDTKELTNKKRKLKSELPAVMISGVGNRKSSARKTEPAFVHSGLLQIDLDKKDHPNLHSQEIMKVLKSDRHVLACFFSPSGGVKGVCAISENEDDHLGCFLAAEKHFKELGLKIDGQPKNMKSLCYLSHDSNPYIASGDIEIFKPLPVTDEYVDTNTQTHKHSTTQRLKNSEEYVYKSRLEKIRTKKKIKERVAEWKEGLDPLRDEWVLQNWDLIEERYTPMKGCRNRDLCDFIAYSVSRYSKEVALDLACLMRELWDEVYNDPMDKHMYEAKKQWSACEYSFTGIMTKEEKEIYDELNDSQKSIFRICKGLSLYEKKDSRRGEFFLSCRELGKRIGVSHEKANRMLREFSDEFELIKIIEVGKAAGRKATIYRWSLDT